MSLCRHLIGAITVVGLAAALPVRAQQCATCDRVVTFNRADLPCLTRRLAQQLAAARDPILISIQSCQGSRDSTRQEMVPSVRSRQDLSQNRIFMLTRADAMCLVKQLPLLPKSQRQFHIELNSCRG